jgi:hypothetical protein
MLWSGAVNGGARRGYRSPYSTALLDPFFGTRGAMGAILGIKRNHLIVYPRAFENTSSPISKSDLAMLGNVGRDFWE